MTELQSYDKWTYDIEVKKVLNHYAEQIQIISFMPGMGGGVIYRILAHNEAYYWEDDFSEIISNQKRKEPLDWPDHDIGYNHSQVFEDDEGNWYSKNPLHQQLTAVHVGDWWFPSNEIVEFKRWGREKTLRKFFSYFKKVKDKKLLVRTHDIHVHTKFPKITTIRLHGPAYRKKGMYAKNIITDPVRQSNVINVNINNILSTDYSEFENEYFSMCENLNINPTPIPVRGYILNYLDRLNNNSNNVIPRIK